MKWANVAANQTVTAADGNFILIAPSNKTYVLPFRDAATMRMVAI